MKPRGNGGPKMPRFNMTWLFTICLITMIILFFWYVLYITLYLVVTFITAN